MIHQQNIIIVIMIATFRMTAQTVFVYPTIKHKQVPS